MKPGHVGEQTLYPIISTAQGLGLLGGTFREFMTMIDRFDPISDPYCSVKKSSQGNPIARIVVGQDQGGRVWLLLYCWAHFIGPPTDAEEQHN